METAKEMAAFLKGRAVGIEEGRNHVMEELAENELDCGGWYTLGKRIHEDLQEGMREIIREAENGEISDPNPMPELKAGMLVYESGRDVPVLVCQIGNGWQGNVTGFMDFRGNPVAINKNRIQSVSEYNGYDSHTFMPKGKTHYNMGYTEIWKRAIKLTIPQAEQQLSEKQKAEMYDDILAMLTKGLMGKAILTAPDGKSLWLQYEPRNTRGEGGD